MQTRSAIAAVLSLLLMLLYLSPLRPGAPCRARRLPVTGTVVRRAKRTIRACGTGDRYQSLHLALLSVAILGIRLAETPHDIETFRKRTLRGLRAEKRSLVVRGRIELPT
jgi:hypothetical protein